MSGNSLFARSDSLRRHRHPKSLYLHLCPIDFILASSDIKRTDDKGRPLDLHAPVAPSLSPSLTLSLFLSPSIHPSIHFSSHSIERNDEALLLSIDRLSVVVARSGRRWRSSCPPILFSFFYYFFLNLSVLIFSPSLHSSPPF